MNPHEQKRILVVDDDSEFASMIRDRFMREGFSVETAMDGPAALDYVERNGLPHAALIDLDLPTWHGFTLSEKLKERGDVPIVFITGEDSTDTVVEGLNLYADDYLRKPFELSELIARVRRVLSRMSDFDYAEPPVIRVDDWLSVDFGKSRLLTGDKVVMLTPTEAGLLHVLMRNTGRVVTLETLIARVWPNTEIYEEALRVHMHRLRNKIEPDRQKPRYIRTERGVGYRFMSVGVDAGN